MNTTHQNLSEYLTRDLYQAVILRLSAIPIIRVENQTGRAIFVFRASPKINEIISSYLNDELNLNPRAVFETWKSLKSMAFAATNNVR
jgi:hypothetical protein